VKRGIAEGRAAKALEKLQTIFGVLVVGDGEGAIHLALNARRGQIIDADNPATELFMSHQSFTDSPWAARHLVDMDSYHYEIEGHKATSIVAQLGCPFGCNFCGGRLSPMLRKIRLRSTESILAELAFLYETYGYTGFMFYDDELNVNPKLIELLRGIYQLQVRLGITFRLRGFVKAELFTTEQAEWMYIAGFRWLLCGFESGSEKILRNIEKKATQADNTRMLVTAHASGIKVKALMSLGHPGESRETIRDTRHWLLEERPDDFDATVITVYPGTPYMDSSTHVKDDVWVFETRGDRLYHRDIDFTVEAAYYKGQAGSYKSYVWTDDITAEELVAERDGLEEEVRRNLGIPYPTAPAVNYEHTMGQGPSA
jgi:anaerobic magnesium-protoporphyrin IX monomethyl ester cyclase